MGQDWKELEGFECVEKEDGSVVCQAEDQEGVCEVELVPDGHGGFKVHRQGGNPETCEKADGLVEQKM